MTKPTLVSTLLITLGIAEVAAAGETFQLPQEEGYRGIWYANQPSNDEFVYKYSGGMATYPQQHATTRPEPRIEQNRRNAPLTSPKNPSARSPDRMGRPMQPRPRCAALRSMGLGAPFDPDQ